MKGRKHIVDAIVLSILTVGVTWLGCKSDETTEPTSGPTIVAPTNL